MVGSGPGGLACADELARRGYAVTVFDSALVPGGLLVNGTPAFKVERSIVQRRIEILQKRGVVFRLGVKLEQNLTLRPVAQLSSMPSSLGSIPARPGRLEFPGADLQGVIQALPFLLQKTTPVPLELAPHRSRRQARRGHRRRRHRHGLPARRHPLRRARGRRASIGATKADMPCSRHEYENAREEGARFVFQAAPSRCSATSAGQVTGLRLVRTELGLMDSAGPRPFLLQPGTEFELPADLIVLALGFDPLPCPHSGDFSDLAVNDWGGIVVDGNQMTSIPGVFAGGDIVRGPSLVLHAVRDARRAAAGIHTFLSARTTAAAPSEQ